jgi:predicted nucleic acid-binding protein
VIVVDTNVICYLYLNSEYSGLADALYRQEPQWVAPLLWRSEFRNVLTMYMRKEVLAVADAMEIFEAAEQALAGNEYAVQSGSVLRLAHQSGCSAHDCEFVSLAKEMDIPLVTMDKKVLAAFPDTATPLDGFVRSL